MTSIRTQYREKRIEELIRIIHKLLFILILEKQQQELIPLAVFKKIRKILDDAYFSAKQNKKFLPSY